ncbi:MAG: hypothetical protein J0H80_10785, partial [Rhizobiales bacterium]|nr:hypothetical protein [Hyphomicrobiales bacterium]
MSFHHRMMLQRYGLGHTTSLYSQVLFDPIFTPIFTAILGAGGLGLTGTALSIGVGLASAIVTTAISIGIQALMAPKPPKAEDGKVPLTQSIPYRNFVVGRTRIAGARMLWEAVGSTLYCVQAIAGHRIQAVNRYFLHDDLVTVNAATGIVTGLTGGRYGGDRVRIFSRLGLSTETPYARFVTALSSQNIWTNAHRGDGQASVAIEARNAAQSAQQRAFPYGAPSLSVEVDGARCWDYRNPAQDPENPSTWTFTRNAALI